MIAPPLDVGALQLIWIPPTKPIALTFEGAVATAAGVPFPTTPAPVPASFVALIRTK